jgi:hypothetical protein
VQSRPLDEWLSWPRIAETANAMATASVARERQQTMAILIEA